MQFCFVGFFLGFDTCYTYLNNNKNVHRYAVGGEKVEKERDRERLIEEERGREDESERDRERERRRLLGNSMKNNQSSIL